MRIFLFQPWGGVLEPPKGQASFVPMWNVILINLDVLHYCIVVCLSWGLEGLHKSQQLLIRFEDKCEHANGNFFCGGLIVVVTGLCDNQPHNSTGEAKTSKQQFISLCLLLLWQKEVLGFYPRRQVTWAFWASDSFQESNPRTCCACIATGGYYILGCGRCRIWQHAGFHCLWGCDRCECRYISVSLLLFL